MGSTEPISAAVVLARQCVRTVDAITGDLPEDIGQPLRDGARQDLAAAEEMALDWLPPAALRGMIARADRARAEAAAETAARALPGETPYETRARLLGRGED